MADITISLPALSLKLKVISLSPFASGSVTSRIVTRLKSNPVGSLSSGMLLSSPQAVRTSREDNNILILFNILEELRNELREIDSPVSPDMSSLVLEIFVRILVVLELLYELSV